MDSDKKLQLIDLLMHEEDDTVLEQVSAILQHSSYDPWDKMEPGLKSALQEGLDDITYGRVFTHKEVLEKLNKRFEK